MSTTQGIAIDFVEPGLGRALLAESRRWQHSGLVAAPLLGLAVAIVQSLVALSSSRATTWNQVLSWTVFWSTSLAQPAAAVLLGLVHRRERRARGGGTWWRPVTPLRSGLARLVITTVIVLIMNLLVVLPSIPAGAILADGRPPVARLLAVVLLLTIGNVAMFPLYDLLAGRWGLVVVAPLVISWSVVGVLTAELRLWWAIPPAWPIRALLPVLGAHANGVALEPGSPIASESFLPAVLLVAGWAGLWLLIFLLLRRFADRVAPAGRSRSSSPETTPAVIDGGTESSAVVDLSNAVSRGRSRPVRAQLTALRRTAIGWLALAALVIQFLVVLIWHRAAYSAGLFELLVLPVGASLLAVLGWQSSSSAWRALAVRETSPTLLAGDLLKAHAIILIAVVVLSTGLIMITGEPIIRAVRGLLLSLTVGWLLMMLSLWLTVRVGAGLAYAVLGIGVATGLVLGAGELAPRLWPFGVWAWAHSAASSWTRTLPIMIISAAIGAGLLPAAAAALKRHAAFR